MNNSKLCNFHLLIILMATAILSVCQACSNNDVAGDILAHSCSLRFITDRNEELDPSQPMILEASPQSITLRLNKEAMDPNEPLPSHFYVGVMEWIEDKHCYSHLPFDQDPADFYNVSVDMENNEPVIHMEFTENLDETDRKIFVLVETGIQLGSLYQNGEIEIIQRAADSPNTQDLIKAVYKEKVYTTHIKITDGGDVEFTDSEYEALMQHLDTLPFVDMLIMGDQTLYYYDQADIDSNKPYTDILQLQNTELAQSIAQTRATGFEYDDPTYLGYFAIFDNDNYKGSKISAGLTNFHFTYNLQNLKYQSMNDKVTSIAVGYNADDALVCSVLTIWEDTDYNHGDNNRSKHRISIVASKNSPKTSIPDLKKVKKIGSSKSWNDCISSISFHFGYIDRLLLDY